MPDLSRAPRRVRPALVVLVLLVVSFGATLVIPLSLTRPPSGPLAAGLVVGTLVFAVALSLVLWVAVAPASPPAVRRWAVPSLVVLALALWWPIFLWAQPGEEPWAWLAGLAMAACALASLRAGVLATAVLGVAAVAGGAIFDGSVVANLLTALACALTLWLMFQVMVWLLRLLAAADAERAAQAELAVAEERLRMSRELHDVLGHRLGIITLKAELAADLATRDPEGAAAEAEQIRQLAAETLTESRTAVQGQAPAELTAQLGGAELVLSSAGIATTVAVEPEAVARLPEPVSRLLAAVVREAVTNVLRHSDARQVSLSLADAAAPSHGILRIVNDGVREPDRTRRGAGSGTGLASLSARCSAAGGRLVAGPVDGDRFEVQVDICADRGPS